MKQQNFNKRHYDSIKRHLQKCAWAIEVADARNMQKTRIPQLETKFLDKLFIVATKTDLLQSPPIQNVQPKTPTFYVSSKTKKGIKELNDSIKKIALQKLKSKEPPIDIFIFGIPNVGKSSLINSLLGRNIAKTGFRSGITRGIQWINYDKNIRLMDAPGVTAGKLNVEELGVYAAVDAQKLTNPFKIAKNLIEQFLNKNPSALFDYYKIDKKEEAQEILNDIAFKRKRLLKGGEPDTDSAARLLILDFQKGRIKLN